MAVASFDTLKYAKALRAAGIPEEQAEAQSQALQEAMQVNLKDLVTKDDLRYELRDVETRLASKIDGVKSDLTSKNDSVKSDLTLLKYMIGISVTATVGVLVRLLFFRSAF